MNELFNHLLVLSTDIGRSKAQSTTDTRCNAEDLSLLQCTRWLLPSAGENANCSLKCTNCLFKVRPLLVVVCCFLFANCCCLLCALNVSRDILLKLCNLCLQGGSLALQIQDLFAQFLNAGLRFLDSASL